MHSLCREDASFPIQFPSPLDVTNVMDSGCEIRHNYFAQSLSWAHVYQWLCTKCRPFQTGILKWSRRGRGRDWMYIHSTCTRANTQLNVSSQKEQISRRGELSMEEKREVVTYASRSPQLLSEFAASDTLFNLGRGEKKKKNSKYHIRATKCCLATKITFRSER